MRTFQELNDTSKYLSHMVFKASSMTSLLSFGLENCYVDDYKHKCKYVECLYFLVNGPEINPNVKDRKEYEKFEEKIISFNSFYDYYEIPEEHRTMYVFKIPEGLIEDYYMFKLKKFHNLSPTFWSSIGAKVPLDFSHIEYNIENEIYRFDADIILDVRVTK
jgi:hypothetical protein